MHRQSDSQPPSQGYKVNTGDSNLYWSLSDCKDWRVVEKACTTDGYQIRDASAIAPPPHRSTTLAAYPPHPLLESQVS